MLSSVRVYNRDGTHDVSFCFYDLVIRRRSVGLLDVAVSVGSSAKHIDRSLLGAMPFAAPGALRNLGPFVFGNHALELYQQLIFGVAVEGDCKKTSSTPQRTNSSESRT